MGSKIEVKRTVNRDFNFASSFCDPSKCCPWDVPCVELELHPQHATSLYSEIKTNEDLKNKFRKQPGSLSMIPLNSQDKEEALEC